MFRSHSEHLGTSVIPSLPPSVSDGGVARACVPQCLNDRSILFFIIYLFSWARSVGLPSFGGSDGRLTDGDEGGGPLSLAPLLGPARAPSGGGEAWAFGELIEALGAELGDVEVCGG